MSPLKHLPTQLETSTRTRLLGLVPHRVLLLDLDLDRENRLET